LTILRARKPGFVRVASYRDGMEDPVLYRRLALLEQQVLVLSEKLGVPCPTFWSQAASNAPIPVSGGLPAEVVDLARAGKNIAAINLLRQLTGMGLREAKDVVESIPPVL
jgi:ribosomal protein L7/L12